MSRQLCPVVSRIIQLVLGLGLAIVAVLPATVGAQTSLRAVPSRDELEPPDQRGWNDALSTAEFVAELGTGDGQESDLDVYGVLSLPVPARIGPFVEDDGSIPLANVTTLSPGRREAAYGTIGDGSHGSSGSASGDFDFYKLAGLMPGQVLRVELAIPEGSSLLAKLALYDSDGERVFSEEIGFLEVTIPSEGTFYICVRGYYSDWPEDPFDSGSGPKAGSEGDYEIIFGLDAIDTDFFGFDLQAGDVVGVRIDGQAEWITLFDAVSEQMLVASDSAVSVLYPRRSPLPRGGKATLAYVIPRPGTYAVSAAVGDGPYTLSLVVRRPVSESAMAQPVLFLDFDGAVINADSLYNGGPESSRLSPMTSFLEAFGLDPTPLGADEHAVIDVVVDFVRQRLVEDVLDNGLNPRLDLQIHASRDQADTFGSPGVSRVIIGGTQAEFGIRTIGLSESVDVGNFAFEETSVVLLDRLSAVSSAESIHQFGVAPGFSKAELVGRAIGTVVAHEAGHMLANFHTGTPESEPDIMDIRRPLNVWFGIGADGVLGTADDRDVTFGISPYDAKEGLQGIQDTRNAVAFGLNTAAEEAATGSDPSPFSIADVYPNPLADRGRTVLRSSAQRYIRVALFDAIGRRVKVLFDGSVMPGRAVALDLSARHLASGVYVVRATDGARVQSRAFVVMN